MCPDHTHEHRHDEQHGHQHHHGRLPIYLYFTGLALALAGFLLLHQHKTAADLLFAAATISAGFHVVIIEGIGETIENSRRMKRFMPNAHILMGLAAIGSSLMGEFWEAALLILIFAGAHFLEEYAEGRSKREITNLLKMNPTSAKLIQADGQTVEVEVESLKIGDHVQVLNGDQVPIDGVIIQGITSIDESSINGESIPKEKTVGDAVYGSTINGNGTFVMEVTKENKDTVFAKILNLVNSNQSNQTKAATIIQKYEPHYVVMVMLVVAAVMLLTPLLFNWSWDTSINRGLLLLVAASPCALAAATVSATLSTTSNLAKKGILSKGSGYISQLAAIKAIAFDKTGTLTKGKPEVTDYHFEAGMDDQQLIDIITALEKDSNHPLAGAVLRKFKPQQTITLQVNNEIGKGISAMYDGHHYSIGKPAAFTNVEDIFTAKNKQWAEEGKTVIYVGRDEAVIGIIALMDIPAEAAEATIRYFKEVGIHTTLITGDSEMTGRAVAAQLKMDEVIADVMPEDKSQIIEEQQQRYSTVAMVGDGVNDAPALVKSDVGIAMGDGTDVAIEVSDIVLMQNNLEKLAASHRLAKKMNAVIWQNIIFALIVVVFLIIVSFTGFANIALSVIIHEGSTLVVILNGLRMLRMK